MQRRIPKKKPVRVRTGAVTPWLVDVPLDHMK